MDKLCLHNYKPRKSKFEKKYKHGSHLANNDIKSKIFSFLSTEIVEPETRIKKKNREPVEIKVENENIKVKAKQTNYSVPTNCAKKDFKPKHKNYSTTHDTYSTPIKQENVSDSESKEMTVGNNDVKSEKLKYKSKCKYDQLESKYDLTDDSSSFESDIPRKESVKWKTEKKRKKKKTVGIEMDPKIDLHEKNFEIIAEEDIKVETDDTIHSATTSCSNKKSKTKYKNCSTLNDANNVLFKTENGTQSDRKSITINTNDIKSEDTSSVVKREDKKLQEYCQGFEPRNLALTGTNNLKKKRKHRSHSSVGSTKKEPKALDSMNISCFEEDDTTECKVKSKKTKKIVKSLECKEDENEMSVDDSDTTSDSEVLNESETSHKKKYPKMVDVPSWILRGDSDSESDDTEEDDMSKHEVKSEKAEENVKSLQRKENKNKMRKHNSDAVSDSKVLNKSEKCHKKKYSTTVDEPPWILRDSDSESDDDEVMSSTVVPTACTESLNEKLFNCDLTEVDDIETLLKMKRKSEELPIETIKQLRQLRIQLRHEVPPQHFVESHAGSHIPTPEQKRRFETYIPIKKGSFNPEEDKIIVHNWKAFCKLHDWDPNNVKPFLHMKHNGKIHMAQFKERQKFVQFLADKLPRRTLYSVLHRFRNLYEPHLGRRYMPSEDECILTHIDHNPNVDPKRKFSDLAKILNRTRASVWRRYRLLKLKEQSQDE